MVLTEGTADVHLHDGQRTRRLARLGAGAVLGEMGLFADAHCTATVTAATVGRLLSIPVDRFRRLSVRYPVLLSLVACLVAARLGQSPVDALSGKVLQGYRIRRRLGRGGMAVVYEAESLASGQRVALKMMSHRLAHDIRAQQRFEREIRICRALRHRNIARLLDHFASFGTRFMVVELCEGGTLDTWIRRHGPLPDNRLRTTVGQLARALAHAHRQGVCHRDLKPSNVMFASRSVVKLVDFGLAKPLGDSRLTAQGSVLGTPLYMAPEQLIGGEIDYRADLFALGCIVFAMLTGDSPFAAESLLASLLQRQNWILPPAGEIRQGLGRDIYQVLQQTLRGPAVLRACGDFAREADAMFLMRMLRRCRCGRGGQPRCGESRVRSIRRACREFEALEDRSLLSAALGGNYDQVLPAWFAAVPAIYGSLDTAAGTDFMMRAAGGDGHLSLRAEDPRWMVRLTPHAVAEVRSVESARGLLNEGGVAFQVLCGLGLPGQLLVRSPAGSEAAAAVALRANPAVAHFERDVTVHAQQMPDDPDFVLQTGLNNTGQDGGTPDADIDAPEAWDITTGSRDVVVAVIDTGVDYRHPDLAANIWANPGEIAGNGTDDDNNGFVDDIHGYDFRNNDGDPLDDSRHGTHVAGTIAAVGDNGLGVTGVAWSAAIMPLKFLGADNRGQTADAVRAINYASLMRHNGVNVRVINASWGSGDYGTNLRDAIAAAAREGILVVAAAGNGDHGDSSCPGGGPGCGG